MSPIKRKRPTTDETVGANLRRLRLASDMGQADLAGLFQEWFGPKWNRDTVASVEAGRRSVTIDEMMTLALLFEVGVIEFFQSTDGTVDDYTREAILTPPLADRHNVEEIYRRMRENADGHLHAAHFQHNPTNDIAKRLGVKPAVLERAARGLWGRAVVEEYRVRLEPQLIEGMLRRSMAIVRGHVVRGLQKELAEKVGKSKTKTTNKEV
jgi:transcriptional regulator with XRE-family HTH domain